MKYFSILFMVLLLLLACTADEATYDYDLQGHRGARGLLPGNTIPGFLKAVEYGVDTIEMDLVVTADGELLVSHEPWFSHQISTKPNGEPVTEEEQMQLNIFEMTYKILSSLMWGCVVTPRFRVRSQWKQPSRCLDKLFLQLKRT